MCRSTHPRVPALASAAAACDKGGVGRLRDFYSINALFSAREIDELQAAIDARREARAMRPEDLEAAAGSSGPETDAPTLGL